MDGKKNFKKNMESEMKSLGKIGAFDLENSDILNLNDDKVDLMIEEYASRGGNILEFAKKSFKENIRQKKENDNLVKKNRQADLLISKLLNKAKAIDISDPFLIKLEKVDLSKYSLKSKNIFLNGLIERITEKRQLIKEKKNNVKIELKIKKDMEYVNFFYSKYSDYKSYIEVSIAEINKIKTLKERSDLISDLHKELKKIEDDSFFGKIKKTMGKLLQ